MKVTEIDIVPIFSAAKKVKHPSVYMEAYRERIKKRIMDGEHIHIRGYGAEECIYPNAQCWKGLRRVSRT